MEEAVDFLKVFLLTQWNEGKVIEHDEAGGLCREESGGGYGGDEVGNEEFTGMEQGLNVRAFCMFRLSF